MPFNWFKRQFGGKKAEEEKSTDVPAKEELQSTDDSGSEDAASKVASDDAQADRTRSTAPPTDTSPANAEDYLAWAKAAYQNIQQQKSDADEVATSDADPDDGAADDTATDDSAADNNAIDTASTTDTDAVIDTASTQTPEEETTEAESLETVVSPIHAEASSSETDSPEVVSTEIDSAEAASTEIDSVEAVSPEIDSTETADAEIVSAEASDDVDHDDSEATVSSASSETVVGPDSETTEVEESPPDGLETDGLETDGSLTETSELELDADVEGSEDTADLVEAPSVAIAPDTPDTPRTEVSETRDVAADVEDTATEEVTATTETPPPPSSAVPESLAPEPPAPEPSTSESPTPEASTPESAPSETTAQDAAVETALPFWAKAEAERQERLEKLKETAIEEPEEEEPDTGVEFDEDFVWSAGVLASQGRRADEVSVEEITWLTKLRQGLGKTRRGLINELKAVVGQGPLNADAVLEIESLLIQADVGIDATDYVIEALQDRMKEGALPPEEAIAYLKEILRGILDKPFESDYSTEFVPEKDCLNIWLLTGVNGAGKTTTIGKLAHMTRTSDYRCLIAAADTFRAAAVEQVKVWGERSGVEVIANPGKNTDPAAVVFDAISAAQARDVELLLVDTAGRLQNKKNLMAELSKIRRIVDKKAANAKVESLLVLDATLGQNGLRQAQVFSEAAKLSGVVLTKLDGSAKGGVALAVVQQLGLPIRFVGAGEGIEDLRPFSSYEFVEALLSG